MDQILFVPPVQRVCVEEVTEPGHTRVTRSTARRAGPTTDQAPVDPVLRERLELSERHRELCEAIEFFVPNFNVTLMIAERPQYFYFDVQDIIILRDFTKDVNDSVMVCVLR